MPEPNHRPAPPALTATPVPIQRWIVAHEDRWTFVLLYVGLAVVLSIFVSLFWLVALLVVHFAFEWTHHRVHHRRFGRILGESLWSVKLDTGLLLLALALTLYLDFVFGLLGLRALGTVGSAAVRGGSRLTTRIIAWQRTIRGVVLTADDAAQATRAFKGKKSKEDAEATHGTDADLVPGPWRGKWGVETWIAISLTAGCACLLVAAPWLTDHTLASMIESLAHELRPFP